MSVQLIHLMPVFGADRACGPERSGRDIGRQLVSSATVVCAALLLGLNPGHARATGVSPVLVELSQARPVVAVTVSNSSEQTRTYQAELLRWQQADGADQYGPSIDLVITPAIAHIAAGQTQVFRVALRNKAATSVEQAYRLILDDISDEAPLTDGTGAAAAIKLRFRFSLPVMLAPLVPPKLAEAQPAWSLCTAEANKVCVRLDNKGNRRIRLSRVALDSSGNWHHEIKGGGTVLAGSWKQWILNADAPPSLPVRVSATGETGVSDSEIATSR